MAAAIEVQSVEFSYGSRKALDQVSFEVAEGKVAALLGPNGGGKTTIFRILSTLFTPDAGTARVLNCDVVRDSLEVRRRIGVVFQASSLDRELTVRENLLHQGHLYGLGGSDLREKAKRVMQRLGVSDRSEDRVKALSGGLQRRVDLAKALLHRPRLLLLDEPTVGLDPRVSREFWSYLRHLNQEEKMTIFLTTHSMDEAERCDELVILSEGQVVSSGTPEALKEKVGGEVVVIKSRDGEDLAEALRKELGLESILVDGVIRVEQEEAHKVVSSIMERFADVVDSITVSQATLEDVFVHETGRHFDKMP